MFFLFTQLHLRHSVTCSMLSIHPCFHLFCCQTLDPSVSVQVSTRQVHTLSRRPALCSSSRPPLHKQQLHVNTSLHCNQPDLWHQQPVQEAEQREVPPVLCFWQRVGKLGSSGATRWHFMFYLKKKKEKKKKSLCRRSRVSGVWIKECVFLYRGWQTRRLICLVWAQDLQVARFPVTSAETRLNLTSNHLQASSQRWRATTRASLRG